MDREDVNYMTALLGESIAVALTHEQPTLRDQFAMAALQGMLADPNYDMSDEDSAIAAYRQADAMLQARAY